MTKNKIKLSLIDDYIKIVLIKNFYSNSFEEVDITDDNKTLMDTSKKLNQVLFSTYELLFEKLKLNDASLDVLKQDLEKNNLMFLQKQSQNFADLKEIFTKQIDLLNNINLNLKSKLNRLKINPVKLFCQNSL